MNGILSGLSGATHALALRGVRVGRGFSLDFVGCDPSQGFRTRQTLSWSCGCLILRWFAKGAVFAF